VGPGPSSLRVIVWIDLQEKSVGDYLKVLIGQDLQKHELEIPYADLHDAAGQPMTEPIIAPIRQLLERYATPQKR